MRHTKTELWTLETMKVFIGIGWIADLIKTSFPTWFSCSLLHPCTFLDILSQRCPKDFFFELPQEASNPRYCTGPTISFMPRIPLLFIFRLSLILVEKYKLDFYTFNDNPKASLNPDMMSIKLEQDWATASRKTSESLANNRCDRMWDISSSFGFLQ